MNTEEVPSASDSIEYTQEILAIKMDLQRSVIDYFCHGDTHNTEKVNAWIQEFSGDYREIFERRLLREADFLERAKNQKAEVMTEIISELEKRREQKT